MFFYPCVAHVFFLLRGLLGWIVVRFVHRNLPFLAKTLKFHNIGIAYECIQPERLSAEPFSKSPTNFPTRSYLRTMIQIALGMNSLGSGRQVLNDSMTSLHRSGDHPLIGPHPGMDIPHVWNLRSRLCGDTRCTRRRTYK